MLAFVDLDVRIPADHPLRIIKPLADRALAGLSPLFDQIYAVGGRPSTPPERLLKASLLIALYSIRSERAFCEELEYLCGVETSSDAIPAKISHPRSAAPASWSPTVPSPPAMIATGTAGRADDR